MPVQAAADRDRAELRPYLSIEALPPLHGRRWSLYLDGPFARGDEARLERFIDAQAIHQADVYLNSPGGSLLAGMAVGRVLRARGYDTHVARRGADPARPMAGVCYSACPFAYAGGVERSLPLGSSLGLHRARNSVPVADAAAFERRVSRDVEEYLSQMGVSPVLARLMEQVPPDGIRLLSVAEAREFGLVTRPQPSR